MTELEKKLEYTFKDPALLETALTHSSYANERHGGVLCNERLEFLGDSILGMVVAEYLYRNCPELPEGKMSRLRAELVCEGSLYGVARELGLGQHLRLGHGEEQTGGRRRPSILADAVEATLAAVYLDGGRDDAEKMITRYILSQLVENKKFVNRDYKTELQERVQRKSGSVLSYRLTGEDGPDHSKVFTVEADINGQRAGTGTGRSKKEAEQAAARDALEALEN